MAQLDALMQHTNTVTMTQTNQPIHR